MRLRLGRMMGGSAGSGAPCGLVGTGRMMGMRLRFVLGFALGRARVR